MKQISIEQLEAAGFYWACRKQPAGVRIHEPFEIEIVQISTVFGAAPEFWSVATMGSDTHFALADYDFFHKVATPPVGSERRPPQAITSPVTQAMGH